MGNPSSLNLSGHGTLLSERPAFVGMAASSSPTSFWSRDLSGYIMDESGSKHTMGFIKKSIPFLPNIPSNLVKGWQEGWLGRMSRRGFKSNGWHFVQLRAMDSH